MVGKRVEEIVRRLDGFASEIAERIPYGRLKIWKDVLFKPKETLRKEERGESLLRGAKDIAVVNLVELGFLGVLFLLFSGFLILLIMIIARHSLDRVGGVANLFLIVVAIVVGIILALTLISVLGWLATTAIEFLAARLLGGKGTFRKHAYLSALNRAAFMLCYLPFSLILIIPIIGYAAYPISLFISIYCMYIQYLVIRQVHKLSQLRSIAVAVIPTLLTTIVMILAIVFIYVIIFVSVLAKK